MAYFGNHSTPLHKSGGYTSNERGAIPYSPEMDLKDGQVGFLKDLQKNYMVTQKQADFKGAQGKAVEDPFKMPASTFFGRSGFANSAVQLHFPTTASLMSQAKAAEGSSYNGNSEINTSCRIPEQMRTETREQFHIPSRDHLTWTSWYADPSGNRDSGYTNSVGTQDPVMWRSNDPTYDQASQFLQPRMNIASVSHTDFQPLEKRTGAEPTPLISSKGTSGSGFRTAKELQPCFAPQTLIYGKRETSYDDPGHYLTTYTIDYPRKSAYCDAKGMRIVGCGPKGTAAESMVDSIHMDYGHDINYETETGKSFLSPWPLPGSRTLWTGAPIGKLHGSGFASCIQRHQARGDPCESPFDRRESRDPQRYNPWPRLNLGYKQMIYNDFRPNPITYGIDYGLYTAAPTTFDTPTTVVN